MNKEAIENRLKGVCQDCMWLEKIEPIFNQLQQENKELQLELSGYRKAILNNDKMLGLQQENEQLKDNWNKLKKIVKSQSDFKNIIIHYEKYWIEIDELLETMQELEKGDGNE